MPGDNFIFEVTFTKNQDEPDFGEAMLRERWAAEDSFTRDQRMFGLGRGASAGLASTSDLGSPGITAGFLYHMGVTFEWEEEQLIAKLGGWDPHKDRKPGKIMLMRGLRRLIDLLATQAILSQYVTQHEALPPNLATFLRGWTPLNEL